MKLTAVVFDWAGTVVDHGSRAPTATLLSVFERAEVPISEAEARLSMGIAKRDHIASILRIPRVANEWQQVHGTAPSDANVDALYESFIPMQLACLADHSAVIAGVPETTMLFRDRGLKIGSTTGYTRPMLDFLLARAKEQGFAPDCALCPGDVPGGGRPAPWMCYLNAIRLEAAPLWTMVKIGDTPSDMEEGRNAGMWTIGITRTGNETGLSVSEWERLSQAEKRVKLMHAADRLIGAGAHFIAESVADCTHIVNEIEDRVAAGAKP